MSDGKATVYLQEVVDTLFVHVLEIVYTCEFIGWNFYTAP